MRICLAKILWSSKLLATPVMCLTQYRCCVVDETENVAVNQIHIYQRESHAVFDRRANLFSCIWPHDFQPSIHLNFPKANVITTVGPLKFILKIIL